jgi:hypothetical protein
MTPPRPALLEPLMNAPFRLALCALLLLVGLKSTGCVNEGEGPPEPPPDSRGEPGACQVDQDCPDPALFFCNSATSRCEAACRTQADCTAERRGNYRLETCDANPLGCRCDGNRCVEALCSADVDCAQERVCRDGRCGAPPEALAVASCQVTPDVVLGREGTPVRFSVLAVDAAGRPVVVPAGATWTAVGAAARGGGTGREAVFELGAPTEGLVEAVRAQVGNATCQARVSVVEAAGVQEGEVRALVTDELTGRPLEGAVVVVADGAGAVTASAETDARGVVRLAAPAAVGSVSVFHGDYGYLTVAHEGPGRGPRELALALRRNATDRYGGYRGTFLNVSTSEDLHAGAAGLSAPDAVTELSGSLLVGPTRVERFTFNGRERSVTLPAGAYVVLPGSTLRATEVSAMGLAGVCDGALAGVTDPEAEARAGTCGTRTAWALAGDVPLSELPPSLLVGGAVDMGQMLAQAIPLLRRFSSSVVRDVPFRLKETPGAAQGAPDHGDLAHFTRVDHDYQQMPLGFHFAARVPSLPRYRGAWLDSVVVTGMARVAGRGMVPLGLGMAVNVNPADNHTDQQAGLPAPGLVSVRMAPAHHGLEGSPYVLAVVATSSAAANDAAAGAATSALLQRMPERLPFDPRGGSPLAVEGAFLPIPEGARYNYDREARGGLEGRQLRFVTVPPLPVGTVLRAVFTHRSERRWVVLMDSAKATTGVRLPVPPAPFEDRTYHGDLAGSRSPFGVQALALRRPGSTTPLELKGLVEADGADLARLGELTAAYSALDYGRPLVRWVVPEQEGQEVARGATVRVRVSSFQVGSALTDDGYVRLTFVGGSGCEGHEVRGDVDASQGRGEVDLRLPPGCHGPEVSLVATLVDPSGVPLNPQVTSARSVNIP